MLSNVNHLTREVLNLYPSIKQKSSGDGYPFSVGQGSGPQVEDVHFLDLSNKHLTVGHPEVSDINPLHLFGPLSSEAI